MTTRDSEKLLRLSPPYDPEEVVAAWKSAMTRARNEARLNQSKRDSLAHTLSELGIAKSVCLEAADGWVGQEQEADRTGSEGLLSRVWGWMTCENLGKLIFFTVNFGLLIGGVCLPLLPLPLSALILAVFMIVALRMALRDPAK